MYFALVRRDCAKDVGIVLFGEGPSLIIKIQIIMIDEIGHDYLVSREMASLANIIMDYLRKLEMRPFGSVGIGRIVVRSLSRELRVGHGGCRAGHGVEMIRFQSLEAFLSEYSADAGILCQGQLSRSLVSHLLFHLSGNKVTSDAIRGVWLLCLQCSVASCPSLISWQQTAEV